jgi:hypothetical protein
VFEENLLSASKVPFWNCAPKARLRAPLDLGVVKQKILTADAFKWWIRGVQQLMVWVGTSRQGAGAKRKSAMKHKEKGKGSSKKPQ